MHTSNKIKAVYVINALE